MESNDSLSRNKCCFDCGCPLSSSNKLGKSWVCEDCGSPLDSVMFQDVEAVTSFQPADVIFCNSCERALRQRWYKSTDGRLALSHRQQFLIPFCRSCMEEREIAKRKADLPKRRQKCGPAKNPGSRKSKSPWGGKNPSSRKSTSIPRPPSWDCEP